jgi:hypothetical protein
LGVNNIPIILVLEFPKASVICPNEKNSNKPIDTNNPALCRFLKTREKIIKNNKVIGMIINKGINILVIDSDFTLCENKNSIGKTAKSMGCKKGDFI